MQKLKRILLSCLWTVIVLPTLYFVATWILGNMATNHDHVAQNHENIAIFIISNGVHTDIALPMKNEVFDWYTQITPHDTASGTQTQAEYVGIGWGDRGFYLDTPTWADLKASTAFKAAFGLSGSALHITYHAQQPTPNELVAQLNISRTEYRRLLDEILPYFQRNHAGKPILIPHAAYGKNDAFYEANGRYGLFHTCNTWTNNRLKNSNLPAVKWTPFAHHIVQHHHNLAK